MGNMQNTFCNENNENKEKTIIRNEILMRREKQSIEKQLFLTKGIIENFLASPYYRSYSFKGKNISMYNSFKGEPDLSLIRDILIKNGAHCYFPITLSDEIVMSEYVPSSGDNQFSEGRLGILEPSIDNKMLSKMDVIFIPGIAFDINGNRIGFGKGYYDKYLSNYTYADKPYTIALIYEFQLLEKIPSFKHDIPVDLIITENRIIETNQTMRTRE